MNSKYKLIAFDVDGTLFSSEKIILQTYIESIQNFINKNNYKIDIPKKEEILNLVGLPVKEIFKNLLPELKEEERNSISDDVLIFLTKAISEKKGLLYEGVVETIQELYNRKYKIAAASNGRFAYIDSILTTYEIKNFFEEIIVIDYKNIKEKGEILQAYQKKYSLNSEQILMVGDRDSDFKAAKFINSDFAFCEYGHANQGEITNFEYKLTNLKDLLNIL